MSASLYRKLDHTLLYARLRCVAVFLLRQFLFGVFRERVAAVVDAARSREAGQAYDGSMMAWERSTGDLLHRLLYTDINSYLVELLMKQDQMRPHGLQIVNGGKLVNPRETIVTNWVTM